MSERKTGGLRPYLLRPAEPGAIWSLGGHLTTKASAAATVDEQPSRVLVMTTPAGIEVVGPPLRVARA